MNNFRGALSGTCILTVTIMTLAIGLFGASEPQAPPPWGTHFLVTNDDSPTNNTATFYEILTTGTLKQRALVKTGGVGLGVGYYATGRVGVLHNKYSQCVYVSDGGSSDIAAIAVKGLTVTGNFKGSTTDSGNLDGIGLALAGKYVYASFTASNTIGTFKIAPGCTLTFVGDVDAKGLNGGAVDGMAAHGSILVVAYADGSIESFNIAKGKPKSNNDAQNSTGFANGALPTGVDISLNGQYAVFGDANSSSLVEVSDISSGKLTPTVVYNVGTGLNSNNVLFSPDGSLLFVSNNNSGQVSAAFFESSTGVLSSPCTSSVLSGFNTSWTLTGSLASELNTGLGGVLYVAEDGQPSSVGIVVPQKGTTPAAGTCTLTELTKGSPAKDPNSNSLLSIGVYPPRTF